MALTMDYSDTTVIIPVMNEPAAGRVTKAVLRRLGNCKVIVIYRGDRKALGIDFTDKNLAVMEQKGRGKGAAVVQAAKKVGTKIMCLIDGDATYEVEDLKKVIALVRDGADMAIGNRFRDLDRKAMPFYIEIGNKVITETANLLYGMRLADSQTGLRAMRTEAFRSIRPKEKFFGIETEMDVKLRKTGCRIAETPIRYYERVGSSKQTKALDGVKLLLIDFKFLFEN
jgi:dolichol-phosphate mannosyltransferase